SPHLSQAPSASALVVASPTPTRPPAASPTVAPSASPKPTKTPKPSKAPTASKTYTVKPGDTLSSIAIRFGTTVKALQALNGIKDTLIKPGQVLKIP
ncbi:MAG TPA: LysM peptidoglycan-binding domain-containing protein, partial [Patescibacteria group bacterium]|nr:LysM peptidoglycan-binding domain-containing protein [Patescibacteria group bacterium]